MRSRYASSNHAGGRAAGAVSDNWNRAINIQQGDSVHHPQHGVGQVQSIRKRSFAGQLEAIYAQIHFKREDLTMIMLEQDLATIVRRVLSATEAGRVLDLLEHWDGTVEKQWKDRANANQAALSGGDPFEYAKVLKSLKRLEAERELRPQDRAHLNQSLDFLTEELAYSLGKTPGQARSLISKASEK